MGKDLERWEDFIAKLVKDYKAKDEVIKASNFLSFLDKKDEWESGPSFFSEIEKYYRKKWIQPNTIEPKLAYMLISGDEGYEFAERWIKTEMLDKSCHHFAQTSIDEFFITEICEESSYATENIIKETSWEEESKKNEVIEFLKRGIYSYIKNGDDAEELILLIESNLNIALSFSSAGPKYTNLREKIGKVIPKFKLKNNFQFALVSKKDLIFRWIFWGLKCNYDTFNLATYIPLHIWYNLEKGEKFSSNAFACLKNS